MLKVCIPNFSNYFVSCSFEFDLHLLLFLTTGKGMHFSLGIASYSIVPVEICFVDRVKALIL